MYTAKPLSRRRFLTACGAACAAGAIRPPLAHAAKPVRSFHVCSGAEGLESDPDRLALYTASGVTDVWVGAFFYGCWPHPPEVIESWLRRIEDAGLRAHAITIPLGHPGDSLGSASGTIPLTPQGWRAAESLDGTFYSGTSLHPPATEENAEALRRIRAMGVREVFLDDDFRLARGPGIIGGCFCPDHRRDFLDKHGHAEARWEELKGDVGARNLSPLLRQWVEYTCDQLTASFRAQQAAVPEIALGNMVMYLGAEKAGIRLTDYDGALLRVGELMFNDKSFSAVKNKTDELFSALFHRRYVTPERAYSETTAFPCDQLSAPNMAAKLTVSTIADVRQTTFMSGVMPFPRSHWDTLAPAMKKQAAFHEVLAGHVPRGPFKHYWGEASRYVGKDKPYSLFLAAGIPFEVTETPSDTGWTFLSDEDGQSTGAGRLSSPGTQFIARTGEHGLRALPESLDELFAFKREILPQIDGVPYVEEDKPVVCAWYPSAHALLLWNLSEEKIGITVRAGTTQRTVELGPLDSALLEDIATA